MDKTREPCVKKMSHLATQNLLYALSDMWERGMNMKYKRIKTKPLWMRG